MKTITVIHCWSAPRSRSTALLYSFEARGSDDCVALDEPLYREWLVQRGDKIARPYKQEMIDGMPPGGPDSASPKEVFRWARELKSLTERILEGADALPGPQHGVIFCKHMAKHCFLYNFDDECQHPESDKVKLVHKHLLLIRDPVLVLSSWENSADLHGNTATPDEVGIVPLLSIYSSCASSRNNHHQQQQHGDDVVLLDSDELAADPEKTLHNLCVDLGIPPKKSMIQWESGPHECDGPWAKVCKNKLLFCLGLLLKCFQE